MTREKFIKVLKKKKYSYRIEGDKIVVTRGDEDWDVDLRALTTLPDDVKFENNGDVWLDSLVGGWFDEWKGNIEGIDSTKLLNSMIKKGIFER